MSPQFTVFMISFKYRKAVEQLPSRNIQMFGGSGRGSSSNEEGAGWWRKDRGGGGGGHGQAQRRKHELPFNRGTPGRDDACARDVHKAGEALHVSPPAARRAKGSSSSAFDRERRVFHRLAPDSAVNQAPPKIGLLNHLPPKPTCTSDPVRRSRLLFLRAIVICDSPQSILNENKTKKADGHIFPCFGAIFFSFLETKQNMNFNPFGWLS